MLKNENIMLYFIKKLNSLTLFFLIFLSSGLYGGYNEEGAVEKSFTDFTSPAELLSEYVSIESISGNEREAGQFLADVCKNMGLNVEIFTEAKDTFNFAASLYPLEANKPNIVLLNHIDVVPADEPDNWTYPPFSGKIVNDTVWGRGTIDNKGMAVMQLAGLQQFVDKAKRNDFPYNITLLSVSGEEVGGFTGAKVISERYLDKLNPVVVYGEGGAGLQDVLPGLSSDKKLFGVSVAAKRMLWVRLSLEMKTSGHSSVPPSSYAVEEMIDALNRVIVENNDREVRFTEPTTEMLRQLGELHSGITGMALRNLGVFKRVVASKLREDEILYSIVSNTATVTGIESEPGAPNQIPQKVTAILDCRLLPEFPAEDYIAKLRTWLDNDDIEIEIINERKIAKPTSVDEYFYVMSDAINHVYTNAEVLPILFPASNDNNYFRSKGLPTYGIHPTYMNIELIETIHNVDERFPIDMLEKGVEVYTELIRQFLYEDIEEKSND